MVPRFAGGSRYARCAGYSTGGVEEVLVDRVAPEARIEITVVFGVRRVSVRPLRGLLDRREDQRGARVGTDGGTG